MVTAACGQDLPEPELTAHAPEHSRLDARGHSLFCLNDTVCDVAMALAYSHGVGRVDIVNGTEALALISRLPHVSKHGFFGVLRTEQQTAVIRPNARCPEIFRADNPAPWRFICAQTSDVIDSHVSDALAVVTPAEAQIDAFEKSLQDGLILDRHDYAALGRVADRVLVEATEASRRGAGE